MSHKDRGIERGTARRLSRDLTVRVVALVLIASALVIGATYLYSTYTQQKKLEHKANQQLAYLKRNLAPPLWSRDNAAVAKLCHAFAQNQELASLVVRNHSRQIIYTQPAMPGAEMLLRSAEVQYQGRVVGSIELGLNPALYQEENQRALLFSGLTVLAVVVILLALTGALVHHLLANFLGDLQNSIDRISSGNYEARKGKTRYQEMERIIQRFNHMAARVKRREDSLSLTNQQLQDEIAERKRAEEALAQSEQRYRQLFDSITDFVFIHDLEGRFLDVNKGAARGLGYEVEDLLGHEVADFMLPQYKQAFFDEYLPAIIREGKLDGISVYLDQDGSKHFIEYRNILVTKNGEPDHVSGIGRDVTERLRSQEKLKYLEEQLRQS